MAMVRQIEKDHENQAEENPCTVNRFHPGCGMLLAFPLAAPCFVEHGYGCLGPFIVFVSFRRGWQAAVAWSRPRLNHDWNLRARGGRHGSGLRGVGVRGWRGPACRGGGRNNLHL